MSNIAIKGAATGTGVFTLESPATNTNRTLTIPDVDGSIVTANASGNVGIGTSSPTNKLHVVGTAKIEGSTLDLNDAGTFTISQNTAASALILRTATSSYMRFDTNGANERMRIDASGRIQVNGTYVVDVARISVSFNGADSTGIGIIATGASGGTLMKYLNSGGSQVGAITTNGTTTTYGTTSDYRLKEDIAPMTGALAKVALLKPVTYKWKSTGSVDQGFIAHELAEVVPECVVGEKDAVNAEGNPAYQGIDTSFLVATLTAAIQEQQAIIEQLQADVATLKGAA